MRVEDRFWSKVEFALDGSGCYLWTGSRNQLGYGLFQAASRRCVSAHRWAYEERNGSIPEGLVIDHLCRNPSCVNPEHLEAVTHRENCLRGLGAPALNARKTVCDQGHPLRSRGNRRHCLQCDNASKKRYLLRNPQRQTSARREAHRVCTMVRRAANGEVVFTVKAFEGETAEQLRSYTERGIASFRRREERAAA